MTNKPFIKVPIYRIFEDLGGKAFPVGEDSLHIAIMAGKDVLLSPRKGRSAWLVNPVRALGVAKKEQRYFTSGLKGKMVVVSEEICQKVHKSIERE